MPEAEIRWPAGTRVRYRKRGVERAYNATLTDDLKLWHSFATIQLDCEAEPVSVWAGEIEPR